MSTFRYIALALVLALLPSLCSAASTKAGSPSFKITRSVVTLTAQAIDYSNGNYVTLSAGEFLVVTSANLDVTMTAKDQLTSLEGYTTDASCYVAAGTTKYFGPFAKNRWADTSGRLQLTWTTSAAGVGITIAPFRLPVGEPESQTK